MALIHEDNRLSIPLSMTSDERKGAGGVRWSCPLAIVVPDDDGTAALAADAKAWRNSFA